MTGPADLATVWEIAAQAPWSFLIGAIGGAVLGFLAADRFRLVRRNGSANSGKCGKP